MRCFVAIDIDENCRAALAEATRRLRRYAPGHKWVNPENMHLTLKFLGDIGECVLPDVISGLRKASGEVKPFVMKVCGFGSFPPRGRPKVIFASVCEQSGMLPRLAGCVESELAGIGGIKAERRRFIPHITLCRVRGRQFCPDIDTLTEKLQNRGFGAVKVNRFVLIKSELAAQGPQYTKLESFKL